MVYSDELYVHVYSDRYFVASHDCVRETELYVWDKDSETFGLDHDPVKHEQ